MPIHLQCAPGLCHAVMNLQSAKGGILFMCSIIYINDCISDASYYVLTIIFHILHSVRRMALAQLIHIR